MNYKVIELRIQYNNKNVVYFRVKKKLGMPIYLWYFCDPFKKYDETNIISFFLYFPVFMWRIPKST